jgi:hypothetical protein
MSCPPDPGQRIEIRDAAGRIVGYFMPAPEYTGRSENGQQPHSGNGNDSDWQGRCLDLTAERDKLRKEIASLQWEIDQYKQALYALIPPPDIMMSAEELREIERDGVTFDQIFEDIEKLQGS